MKRLVIQREPSTDEGTFGVGVLNENEGQWQFIELPWRDNACDISCVPAGVYTARVFHSQHFQRDVYRLEGVPGREDVEMHPANFAGDVSKGWQSDLRGCCAPGMERGHLYNKAGHYQAAVLQSARAMEEILAATGGEPIEIEFKDAP